MSTVEKLLGNPLGWDPWTTAALSITNLALLGLKENRYTAPVEVLITSARDETLAHYRLRAWEPRAMEVLEFNGARLNTDITDIFPVRATITDGTGRSEIWESDPRPKTVQ